MELKRILIAGEGGQGVQAIAKILIHAAFKDKKQVTFLPNFGVEQRGGVSLAFVQVAKNDISFPKFQKADIVVVLTERALKRIEGYFKEDTILIFDNSMVSEQKLKAYRVEKVAIPALFYAKEKLIPKVFNMIILGALFQEIGGLSEKVFEKTIGEFFEDKIKKEPQLKHFNIRAFQIGADTVKLLKEEALWRKKSLAK